MLNNAKRHDSLVNSSWVPRGWQASLSYGKLGGLFEVLYSTVRPAVHTNPSRRQSENVLRKCSSDRRNLKMSALNFSVSNSSSVAWTEYT